MPGRCFRVGVTSGIAGLPCVRLELVELELGEGAAKRVIYSICVDGKPLGNCDARA